MTEKSIIRLPEDQKLVVRLRNKLEEYERRQAVWGEENPYLPPEECPQFFATMILQELLMNGLVDVASFREEKNGHIPTPKQENWFLNYCNVIAHYALGNLDIALKG